MEILLTLPPLDITNFGNLFRITVFLTLSKNQLDFYLFFFYDFTDISPLKLHKEKKP